jgi:hypothetical protein
MPVKKGRSDEGGTGMSVIYGLGGRKYDVFTGLLALVEKQHVQLQAAQRCIDALEGDTRHWRQKCSLKEKERDALAKSAARLVEQLGEARQQAEIWQSVNRLLLKKDFATNGEEGLTRQQAAEIYIGAREVLAAMRKRTKKKNI